MDWLLNALVGLGILVVISVLIYVVIRWRQRYDAQLEEADRRYQEAEAERKARESRWSE